MDSTLPLISTALGVGLGAAYLYTKAKAPTETRPANVGILAMESYFPKNCLPLTALEKADGCEGKYTVGLGQDVLAYFDDREDVASVLLTALSRLLENYGISPDQIGRLEVGTETLIDKSKSVKTTLLGELFGANADVEGVTSTNACYGGTAALLNSLAWVESSAWDGRYAVVVTGDIAVYEKGPARPTSGGGAVAMLIGPDAPLAFSGLRCTHAAEVWDFYKPRGDIEYPTVDGKLSQTAYLTAVDECWAGLKAKLGKAAGGAGGASAAGGGAASLDSFDYACMHSPYNKLVQKGFARLVNGDLLAEPSRPEWAADEEAQKWAKVPAAQSVNDRDAEKVLKRLSDVRWKQMCSAGHTLSKAVGNCYTAAVYMNLLSLVSNVGEALVGKKVLLFSYGSGAVATAFVAEGRTPTTAAGAPFSLGRIAKVADITARLASRATRDVSAFSAAMDLRAKRYGKGDYEPTGAVADLFPGTYYLVKVDALHRRTYARKA